MQKDKLTFNDLPEVVSELCERISSMENLLTEKLHQQHNEVKKDTHVPMTVDEVCKYLGISKSSFYYKAKHGGIPVSYTHLNSRKQSSLKCDRHA